MKRVDIVGKTYGQLTVISEAAPRKSGDRNIRFVTVKCTCGIQQEVGLNPLRMGHTTSCGCHRKKTTGDRARTHGGSHTRLHRIWKNMRQRCNNPNHPNHVYYGGRGITICDAWNDFNIFREWATTHGYAEDLTIERMNNNDNYHPGNCTWATRLEQANNRNQRGYLS